MSEIASKYESANPATNKAAWDLYQQMKEDEAKANAAAEKITVDPMAPPQTNDQIS